MIQVETSSLEIEEGLLYMWGRGGLLFLWSSNERLLNNDLKKVGFVHYEIQIFYK
jgi:uncharacterized protein YwqG